MKPAALTGNGRYPLSAIRYPLSTIHLHQEAGLFGAAARFPGDGGLIVELSYRWTELVCV